jgi:DNA-binding MarR family transcriptional regulator
MTNNTARNIAEYSRILTQMFCDVIEHNYLLENSPVQMTKTQFAVLKILRLSGPFLVSEIATILQISRAAASKNVDKLVHDKLVSRKIIEEDRRTTQVSLLPAGEKIVDEFEALRESKQNAALAGFTQSEQIQLSELLGRYVRRCLQQENEIDLLCLQCNGSIREECRMNDREDNCRFYYKVEKKQVNTNEETLSQKP